MSIKEKLIIENKELADEWKERRKVVIKKYLVTGFVKFALFTTAIQVGSDLLNHKIEINSTDLMIIIGISILAPFIA